MATIKHPDTFKCDVCGREIERAHSITLPVRWTTEQNEGRPCTPYVKEETIDLCDECFERAVDWALDHLKDGDEIACEHFKP